MCHDGGLCSCIAVSYTHLDVYKRQPLYRQLDIFEREGIHLSPSTVSNWMMAAAQRLELSLIHILLPKYNLQGIDTQKLKIELVPVRKVEEAFRALFG